MRIPHTINPNYFKAYEPSEVALSLVPESLRNVQSENTTWDDIYPPKLSDLCVLVIVANFGKKVILHDLPCWDKNFLLESLSTDLPLPLVVNNISEDIYWKRKVKSRWEGSADYCESGSSWKKMYLERHVQEAVEAMTPEGFDIDVVKQLCKMSKDYVEVLNLRELQILKSDLGGDEDDEDEDEFAVTSEPCDHIDLSPIITGLTNLKELHVQFGLRNLGSGYEKSLFQFSLSDCRNLGLGVAHAKNLKFFRLHSSCLDDQKLIELLSNMGGNESLEVIDFSNCLIGDDGAAAISRFLRNRPTLHSLNLSNNRIGEVGVATLAFALVQVYSSPIQHLNLKFNRIEDAGLKVLASALVRENIKIETLNVSCCGLEEESAIYLGEVLNRNKILIKLDVSNNNLGEGGGRALEAAIFNSKTIQYLDMRLTGISDETIENTVEVLRYNRIRAAKGEKGVEREIRLKKKREEDELRRIQEEEERAREEALRIAAEEAARLAAAMKEEDPDE